MNKKTYQIMKENEDYHWWFVARRSIIQKILTTFLPNKSVDILEVGCGSGGNLSCLSQFGTIFAMECDDDALAFAKQRKIGRIKKGAIPNNIPFNNPFDLICMLDVLEHIDDDAEAITSLKQWLVPNGKLLITVPAYMMLWSGHDDVNHHYRRYTLNQLNQLLSNNGFNIIYKTYFNTWLFPAVLALRTLNNILKRTPKSDVKMPNQKINHILRRIFESESKILPKWRLPFGVSALILAENTT